MVKAVSCAAYWATDVWAGYMNGATLFSLFATAPDVTPLFGAAQADIAALQKHQPRRTLPHAVPSTMPPCSRHSHSTLDI